MIPSVLNTNNNILIILANFSAKKVYIFFVFLGKTYDYGVITGFAKGKTNMTSVKTCQTQS